jgi:IS6 family transposase
VLRGGTQRGTRDAESQNWGPPHRKRGFCCKNVGALVNSAICQAQERSFTHEPTNPFQWRHFEAEIILLCVRWYLRYPLSYRHLEEMMSERGLSVDHTTIYRWVQHFAPELDRRCRAHLKATTDSWHVDETYVKVKGTWMYLYRAVDAAGNTLEFRLSPTRDAEAAKRFFHKTLEASHTVTPRVITVDKNAAYPKALTELKAAGAVPDSCELRQVKYLNNVVEQDHRIIKRLVKPGLGFFAFETAWRTLQGYEAMHMIRKGQVKGMGKGDGRQQARFIASLFGAAA